MPLMHLVHSPLRLALVATLIAVTGACAPRSSQLLTPELRGTCDGAAALDRPAVIANYNIKSGEWSSLDEVGEVLEGMAPDVVALEEVDRGMKRSGSVDQSAVLAERLGMERIFAGAQDRDGGSYGIALLSRLPFMSAVRFELPDAGGFEPRVAIDAEVCAGERPLRVVCTHSDFTPWAADAHARALAEHIGDDPDVVVLGDLNITPDTDGMKPLLERPLTDALAVFDDGPTFGDDRRIDFILTDNPVTDAHIIDADASDHRPVMATIDVPSL